MKQILCWLLTPYRGSNRISLYLRRFIDGRPWRELVGLNLASLAFLTAVVVPQTEGLASTTQVYLATQETVVEIVPTKAKFRWPLTRFSLSQRFSLGHPGLDLTAPAGSIVYPVANGKVGWTNFLPWGYGKHLLINHDETINSLYAHLSAISVKPGDIVTKEAKIGEVGSTGWSTGNHLHLEIYQDGVPINPLEVLPALPKSK